VTLRVIRVEPDKRRLGLSLKRVTHGEYMDEDWRAALAEVNTEETTPSVETLPPAETTPPVESLPPPEADLPDQPAA
jgi:hypothetical protein